MCADILAPGYSVVVGIDFGTSQTGFWYALTSNPDKLYANKTWPGAKPGEQTTTEVLLKRDDESVIAFGHDARNLFYDSDTPEDYLYFANFKMTLHNVEGMSRRQVKASNCDVYIDTVKLISLCVRHLVDTAYEQIYQSNVRDEDFKRIRWVITVPAIWDIAARHAMYAAARMAGVDEENIIIALEPEVALLTCVEEGTEGRTLMVVDAGGGTIDITVHRQVSLGTMLEVHPPSGGAWGSVCINARFAEILVQIFGQEHVNMVKDTTSWLQVMDYFERAKVSYSPKTDLLNVVVGPIMAGIDVATVSSNIATFNTQHNTNISLKPVNYVLRLNTAVNFLFHDVISKTVSHVAELLGKPALADVKHMYVVGGFAECPLLQQALKDAFKARMAKVIITNNPSTAIVTGAVKYGLNPNIVASRVAPRSFGLRTSVPWNHAKHKGREKTVDDAGRVLCVDGFDPFVRAGDKVNVDQVRIEPYFPVFKHQTSLQLAVYVSDRPDTQFITDPGVRMIGYLDLEVPDPGKPVHLRQVDVAVKFGGTTYTVCATYVRTKASVSAKFRFTLENGEEAPVLSECV